MRSNIKAAVALVAVAGLLLTGCASMSTTQAQGNLAEAANCADLSVQLTAAREDLKSAKADVKELKDTPGEAQASSEVDRLTSLIEELDTREDECESEDEDGTLSDDGVIGVGQNDGTAEILPVINGDGQPVIVDSTTNPATPALLDGSLQNTNQSISWSDLVKRVGNQQWYIDGVNTRAAYTGFTWEDVLRFAKVNTTKDGEAAGVEARVIQVFNWSGLTDAEARDKVRPYIGDAADTLHIVRIDGGFVNTRNVNKYSDPGNPAMGNFFDTQQMVRVSLVPIVFDTKGKPIGLDISRGAGIFIDCGNLHWVPPKVWECTDSSCTPPPPPPSVCPWNPTLPPDSPDCLQPKDWDNNPPKPDGIVPLPEDGLEPRPELPADSAPVLPEGEVPDSDSQAPGATLPDPDREIPDPGTGEGGGSVNPEDGGPNDTDPGNPF